MRLCKCEAVSKAKYLDLGSPRRVARDAGTDVNTSQYVYKAYGIVVAPWHQNTARSAKFRQCWKTGYSLCIIVVKGSVRKADVETTCDSERSFPKKIGYSNKTPCCWHFKVKRSRDVVLFALNGLTR